MPLTSKGMSVPEITVVVPVYNVQAYLPKCIDSLLAQTFGEIEIILVDDGSTDASGAVCDSYAERDSRIRVVHQRNAGVSGARNAGIRLARGRYLGFVDSDDWVDRDFCRTLYRGATDYGADISICSYYEVGEQGMRCGASGDGGDTVVYDRREALRLLYEDSLIRSYFWDKLFKRELFDGVLFPEDHTVFEDMAIMYKLFYRANRIVQQNVPLYYYLLWTGSILHSGFDPQAEYRFFLVIRERVLFLREKNVFPEDQDRFEAEVLKRGAHVINHISVFGEAFEFDAVCRGIVSKMHDFDRLKFSRIGWGTWFRRRMLYGHYGLYIRAYRVFRKIFKSKSR